jgi:hypothetical protein
MNRTALDNRPVSIVASRIVSDGDQFAGDLRDDERSGASAVEERPA